MFPINVGVGVTCSCDAVYSFVLDQHHTMLVNGVECVCLGHNFKGPVVGHQYFGSPRIVADMEKMVGWSNGLISILYGSCIKKDAKTGLTVSIYQDQQLLQEIGTA